MPVLLGEFYSRTSHCQSMINHGETNHITTSEQRKLIECVYVGFIYKYVLCFSMERILCSVKRDSAFFPVVHSTFKKSDHIPDWLVPPMQGAKR